MTNRFINPRPQFLDTAGNPLKSGEMNFYENGTLDRKNTYKDINKTILNDNPIKLTADGILPNCFYDGTARVTLTHDPGTGRIERFDENGVGDGTTDAAFIAWSSIVEYEDGAIVVGSDEEYYRSIQNGNLGNDPISTPAFWEQIQFIRLWNANITYAIGNFALGSDGNFYASLQNNNLNKDPVSEPTWWAINNPFDQSLNTTDSVVFAEVDAILGANTPAAATVTTLAVSGDITSDVDGTDSIGSTSVRFLKGWYDDLEATNGVVAANLDGVLGANTPAAINGTTGNFSGQVDFAASYIDVNGIANLERLAGSGRTHLSAWNGLGLYFQLITNSDGSVDLHSNGAKSIKLAGNQDLVVSGNILPETDNTKTLGNASFRMSEIFAANGTINTSDEREKTMLVTDATLVAKEKAVADAIRADMRKYKWNDAIIAKGEASARIHYGVSAQAVKAAFEAQGLNPAEYAMFCYDEFPEMIEKTYQEEEQATEVKAVTRKVTEIIDGVPTVKEITKDEDVPMFNLVQKQDELGNLLTKTIPAVMGENEEGNPIELTPERQEPDMYPVPVMKLVTKIKKVESGVILNRHGVRYHELWAFLTMHS